MPRSRILKTRSSKAKTMPSEQLLTRPAILPVRSVAREPSERQQKVLDLVQAYYAVAEEWPTSGWLSRRLNISRARAWHHLQRARGFLDRH